MKRVSRTLVVAALVALVAAPGCGVKAYQRGHLAKEIMQYEKDAGEESRELKWFEAREGSNGGVGGAGGGCACN